MLEIRNFTTNEIKEEFLEETAEAVFRVVNKKDFPKLEKWGKIEISLAIIGNARMRKLNKMYRGKNRVTDVLSFGDKSVFEYLNQDKFVEAPDNIKRLGEVVICYPRAKKQAKEKGHSLEKEIAILLIHGILHLLGFTHEQMESVEEKILNICPKKT
jgi:probable rRNA maturation factor